jgi:putative phage-type endonuclease
MDKELVQGSPEWLELRRSKVGASDAAVILGLSPWTTPYQLWEQKLGLRDVEVNSAMRRGSEMEEEARKEFEHLTGLVVFPDVCFHPEHEWMMASLDGIDMERKNMVEIKCVSRKDHQTAIEGNVPDKYYPQLQHQLAVTGLQSVYYFSYDPLNPVTLQVARDEAYIADMIEKEKEFYRCVMNFEAPSLCDRDYVDLSNDVEFSTAATFFLTMKKQREVLEKEEERYRKRLIEISENRNAKGAGIRMTKFIRKGNIEYGKVAELQGVNLDKYRKPPTESWRIGEFDG